MSGSQAPQPTPTRAREPFERGWLREHNDRLRRHWYVALPILLICVAAGLIVGLTAPTVYTAEARLAVGRTDLASYQVPGYAAAVEELASDYARYLGDVRTDPALLSAMGGEEGLLSIVASPVPDSNVIRVEAWSHSNLRALQASNAAAEVLRARVNDSAEQGSLEELLSEYREASRASAVARAERDRAASDVTQALAQGGIFYTPRTEALVEAQAELDVLDARQAALEAEYQRRYAADGGANQLTLIGSATITGDDRATKWQLGLIFGAAGGYVLGAVAALMFARRAGQNGASAAPRVEELQFQ